MNTSKYGLSIACPLPSGRDCLVKGPHPSSEFIKELRNQWKALWKERFDDKTKAEGIASKNYPYLLVERGTVIIATRDFKPLDFHEILKFYGFSHQEINRYFPNPHIGGWGKFIRETIKKRREQKRTSIRQDNPKRNVRKKLPAKKGGRGWIHSL